MLANDGRRQCRRHNNVLKCPQYLRANGRSVGSATIASVKEKKCLSLASQVSVQFLCLIYLCFTVQEYQRGCSLWEGDGWQNGSTWREMYVTSPTPACSTSISNKWDLNADFLSIHSWKMYIIFYYSVLLQGDEIVSSPPLRESSCAWSFGTVFNLPQQ